MPAGLEEAGLAVGCIALIPTTKDLVNLYHTLHNAASDCAQLQQELAMLNTLLQDTMKRAITIDELPIKQFNCWKDVLDTCLTTAKELEQHINKYNTKKDKKWGSRKKGQWLFSTVKYLMPRLHDQVMCLRVIHDDLGMLLQTAQMMDEFSAIRTEMRLLSSQRSNSGCVHHCPESPSHQLQQQLQGTRQARAIDGSSDTPGIYPWENQNPESQSFALAIAPSRITQLSDLHEEAMPSKTSLNLRTSYNEEDPPSSKSSIDPLEEALDDIRACLDDGWSASVDSTTINADGDRPIYFRNAATGARTYFCPADVYETSVGQRKRLFAHDGMIIERSVAVS